MRKCLLILSIIILTIACDQDIDYISPEPNIQALQRQTFTALWSTVDENYVYSDFNGVDWQSIHDDYSVRLENELAPDEFITLLEDMLAELPENTARLQTREERIDGFNISEDVFGGIGVIIDFREEPEPRLILRSVLPGSPAEDAGLQAHDSILAVDGEPVTRDAADIVLKIRGKIGSEVVLTVRSANEPARDIIVTRGRIQNTGVRLRWEAIDDKQVGYFLFPPTNYDELLEDFALGLQTLAEGNNLNALVLDLRIVSANARWPIVSLLTLFTDGNIGEYYSRQDTTPIPISGNFDFANTQELPVAVLTGPSTTGRAEVFAATLQTKSNATVVGLHTPGEVELVTSYYLPDGTRVLVATMSYRTAGGVEIGLQGVTPDVLVDVDWDGVTAEDDPVLRAALEALSGNDGQDNE